MTKFHFVEDCGRLIGISHCGLSYIEGKTTGATALWYIVKFPLLKC